MNFQTLSKKLIKKQSMIWKTYQTGLMLKKFALNVSKTDHKLKIRLNGKKLYSTDSVKYLAVHIDKNLNWKHHINNVVIKLSKENAKLSTIRHYVDIKILRSIYHAIF